MLCIAAAKGCWHVFAWWREGCRAKCSWRPILGLASQPSDWVADLSILMVRNFPHFIIPPPPIKNQGVWARFVDTHKFMGFFRAFWQKNTCTAKQKNPLKNFFLRGCCFLIVLCHIFCYTITNARDSRQKALLQCRWSFLLPGIKAGGGYLFIFSGW